MICAQPDADRAAELKAKGNEWFKQVGRFMFVLCKRVAREMMPKKKSASSDCYR